MNTNILTGFYSTNTRSHRQNNSGFGSYRPAGRGNQMSMARAEGAEDGGLEWGAGAGSARYLAGSGAAQGRELHGGQGRFL